MPFTPFHFGPGLFIKSLAPRYFSWLAFIAAQVVIDCETLFYLMQRRYPLHRALHTFPGAIIAGSITAVAILVFAKLIRRTTTPSPFLQSEVSTLGLLAGGIIGGASHPLLDGMMHSDIRPFAPWSHANPLFRVIDTTTLHLLCFALGIAGLIAVGISLLGKTKYR